jgi:hypothetical protein
MTHPRTKQTPQQLGEVLIPLDQANWPTVWTGPPGSGLALDDWRAVRLEADLGGTCPERPQVRGAEQGLYPVLGGGWSPVRQLSWIAWFSTSSSSADARSG